MATKPKRDTEQSVITPIGIVSFPSLFKPKAFKAGDDPMYRMILVFDTEFAYITNPALRKQQLEAMARLRKGILAAAVNKFGADYKTKGIKLRSPVRPSSDYDQYGAPFDKPGRIFVSVTSNTQPGLIDPTNQPIIAANDFYAGCFARASVYCHGYDTKGNKGVTLLLNNVQKTGDGERFGGSRPDASEEFDRLETSAPNVDHDI